MPNSTNTNSFIFNSTTNNTAFDTNINSPTSMFNNIATTIYNATVDNIIGSNGAATTNTSSFINTSTSNIFTNNVAQSTNSPPPLSSSTLSNIVTTVYNSTADSIVASNSTVTENSLINSTTTSNTTSSSAVTELFTITLCLLMLALVYLYFYTIKQSNRYYREHGTRPDIENCHPEIPLDLVTPTTESDTHLENIPATTMTLLHNRQHSDPNNQGNPGFRLHGALG